MPASRRLPCRRVRHLAWLCVLAVVTAGADDAPAPQALEPDSSTKLELGAASRTTLRLRIPDQAFVEVAVYALQTPISLRQGTAAFDSPLHGIGHHEFLAVAGQAQPVAIELATTSPAGLGRIAVTVTPAMPIDATGQRWLAADRETRAAFADIEAATGDVLAERLAPAIATWQALGHDERYAHALAAIAFATKKQADKAAAIDWFARALAVPSSLRPWLRLQVALYSIDGGERQQAEATLKQGLVEATARQDVAAVSALHSALGLLAHSFGELDTAEQWYERALADARQSGYDRQLAVLANNIAGIHYLRGEPDTAFTYFDAAIDAHRRLANRVSEGEVLYNKASLYLLIGDLKRALPLLTEALDIVRAHEPGSEQEAFMTAKLGSTLFYLGQFEAAQNFLSQALELHQANESWNQYAHALVTRGELQRARGDLTQAEAMHRDAIARFEDVGRRDGEVRARLALTDDLLAAGDTRAAAATAATALALATDLERPLLEAEAAERMARAMLADGQIADVAALLDRAMLRYAAQDAKLGEARVHTARARLALREGDSDAALALARTAQRAVRDLRASIPPSDYRAGFFAQQLAPFDLEIDVLMQGFADRGDVTLAIDALRVAERASASVLEERLQHRAENAATTSDIDLQQAITAKAFSLRQFGASDNEAELRRAQRDMQALLLRGAGGAAETSPARFSLPGVQAALADGDVLLRFWLSNEHLYWWRISGDEFAAGVFDGAHDFGVDARALHQSLRYPRRLDRAARARLSRLLEPLQSATPTRLWIVAHGDLALIPFEILVRDGAALFETTVVQYLPGLEGLSGAVPRTVSPADRILIVADPVYGNGDPRLATTPLDAETNAMLGGALRLRRLPGTRNEAAMIDAMFAPGNAQRWTGLDAHKAAVQQADLDKFSILHLAVHGQVDTEIPSLSALVLSRVDANGRLVDSELTLRDIYQLQLDAELVVLSACETQGGQRLRGEGMLSLARGFVAAGARSVVSTLWPVSDKATAWFMQRFYSYMLRDGLSAGQALAASKRDMRAHAFYGDPYYYAGFVLIGN